MPAFRSSRPDYEIGQLIHWFWSLDTLNSPQQRIETNRFTFGGEVVGALCSSLCQLHSFLFCG